MPQIYCQSGTEDKNKCCDSNLFPFNDVRILFMECCISKRNILSDLKSTIKESC